MAADSLVDFEGLKVEVEGEKCSSYRDLPSVSVGDVAECNGEGKDDYVFVNGSDVSCDDHVEPDVNGEVNAVESSFDSREELDSGGDNVGDSSEFRHVDPIVDDEKLNLDSREKVGGDDVVNGDQELEVSDKSDNEVRIDGKVSEDENRVDVQGESDGRDLVVDNGEIKLSGVIIVEDEESTIDNGGSNNVECEVVEGNDEKSAIENNDNSNAKVEIDVKVSDAGAVEGNYVKPLTNGFSDGESCIDNGDNCNSLVDGLATLVLDGDDNKVGVLEEPNASLSDDNEVKTGTAFEHNEEELHPLESQIHENLGNEPETPISEAEDNGESHVPEGLVRDFEPLDSKAEESKPSEADVLVEDNGIPEDQVRDLESFDSKGEVSKSSEADVVSEDNGVPHISEGLVRDFEPLDSKAEESKSSEADIVAEDNGEPHLPDDLVRDLEPLDRKAEVSKSSEAAEDNGEPHISEDLVRDLKPLDNEAEEPKSSKADVVAEDNGEPDISEGLVRDLEPLDTKAEESKSYEADVVSLNNDLEGLHLPENSEPQTSDVEAKASSLDDAITNQQTELELTDGVPEEIGTVEVEAKAVEQGELVPPEVFEIQEHSSMNSEAVISEPIQSAEGGVIENVQELHTDLLQSEGVDVENGVESSVPEVERLVLDDPDHADIGNIELPAEVDQSYETSAMNTESDTTDKPAADCDLKRDDLDETSELIAEEVENQESSIEEDAIIDQVGEDSAAIDVLDKEIVLEDIGLEKNMVVEEAANGPAMDDLDSTTNVLGQLETSENEVSDHVIDYQTVSDDVIHNQAVPDVIDDQTVSDDVIVYQTVPDDSIDNQTVPSDLSEPVDAETVLLAPSDLDPIKEQGLADTSSYVASVNDTSPHNNVESEVDVVNKSNGISNNNMKPKISFGSFECEALFTHDDVYSRPEVLNRSVELNGSESKAEPSDDVTLSPSDANGVPSSVVDHDKASEDMSVEHVNKDTVSTLPITGSGAADVINGQIVRPFHYLIRVPKYDDENLREKIRLCDMEVREKTQSRDSVRIEYLKAKEYIGELKSALQTAKLEERAARDLVMSKKREIDSALSIINLAKNAVTVEDVESRILNMEHKIQHETLNLYEEKQLVREIKQMNQLKGQLNASTRSQEKLQQALDQRGQVEENLKVLRKEIDALRDKLSKVEQSVQIARKKYDDKSLSLNELYNKFKSADNVRQKAYEDLLALKKQLSEKNKYFWNYKDDATAANELAVAGDKVGLERHCFDQVEKFMDLWNKDDEFRKEYIRCNKRSTLRRFRTLDGRSLGPNEEPPSMPIVSYRETSLSKYKSTPTVSTIVEREVPSREDKEADNNSLKKVVVEEENKIVPNKVADKSTPKNSSPEASGRSEIVEEEKLEVKPTQEEAEIARKAEQLRREEEAAKLREQRKLEEKVKAKEALERKKKMAEKAQARAEFKALKEAEQKEKEREKRAKKKEKKKGFTSDIAETEPTVLPEISSETTREAEITEKPVTVTKKPSSYTKQMKTSKVVPPPIRNKSKKKLFKQWLCAIIAVIIFITLFYLGDSNFFRNWTFRFSSTN